MVIEDLIIPKVGIENVYAIVSIIGAAEAVIEAMLNHPKHRIVPYYALKVLKHLCGADFPEVNRRLVELGAFRAVQKALHDDQGYFCVSWDGQKVMQKLAPYI